MMNKAMFYKNKLAKAACSFATFMQMALYDSDYGYYTTKEGIFGPGGDFVTAPELSPIFGYTLAKQMQSILANTRGMILELGAGSGQLCVDVLSFLEQNQALPEKYLILEVSGHLRQVQAEKIKRYHPRLLECVEWISAWPQDFSGVVVANEVLDAMPVHRFLWKDAQVYESFISYDVKTDNLKEDFILSQNLPLNDYVQALQLPKDSLYCSEVNLLLPGWLAGLEAAVQQGVVLLLDYGYPRHEYYHPDRHQGTLMCHYQQRSHPDYLYQPGQQDISAHVDFTWVAESAHDLGFDILGYSNQASFLLSSGILDLLASDQPAINQAKILLQSQEMGELFKVMALGKNFDHELIGFRMFDKRMSL